MLRRVGARGGGAIDFRRPLPTHMMERLAFRLLDRLASGWRGVPDLRIAAFPADELGRQIAVYGLSERDSLLILFDHILSGRAGRFRSQVAVDVGANVGNHALFLAGRFGRVIAFEPHPVLARMLEINTAINGFDTIAVQVAGLSDRDGTAPYLEIAERNVGGSGLVETHWSGGRAAGRTIDVRLIRGDDALAGLCRPEDIGLIKIDVEGHEEAVIRGLERTLRAGDPVVLFEVRTDGSLERGLAAWALLERFGYGCFHVIEALPGLLPRAPAPLRWAVNIADRMVRGVRYRARRIERFEPCRQEFVIAARRPLF